MTSDASPGSHRSAARRIPWRATISVALVLALTSTLFAANARLARGGGAARHPQNLTDLLSQESDRLDLLQQRVDEVRSDVTALTAEAAANTGGPAAPSEAQLVAAGATEVSGPGLTIRLDDAPQSSHDLLGVHPDDLVVHQQDVQAVMNALWAGGAEAMSLMDQRVISTSAFKCIGSVLALQGRRYSPPYVIRAIGDPQDLLAALDGSRAVRIYRQYVDVYGLGWETTKEGNLDLPAYVGAGGLRYATVPDGVSLEEVQP